MNRFLSAAWVLLWLLFSTTLHATEPIAPIEAPFQMPQLQRPVFADAEVHLKLRKKGNNAPLIQRAIDKLAAKGGGRVVLPAGHWQTGRIELRSGINLVLSEGCYLHFSGKAADYLPVVFSRDEGIEAYCFGAFIYAHDAHRIAVTGSGHIVGPSTDCEIYQNNNAKALNAPSLIGKRPIEERIFDGKPEHFGGAMLLPKSIAPINCSEVLIEGITLDSSLYWNIVPQYCDSVIIRRVTVNSFGHGRTDGIDIESSRNVLVEYCVTDCQDDNFCMKSGRGWDGLRVNRPTEKVVVRHCTALRGASGIVCGTETAGSVRDIYCHDCVFDGTDYAVRLKTRRLRGGKTERIYVQRIKARNLTASALCIDELGSKKWEGELAKRHFDKRLVPDSVEYGGKYTPTVRSIYINDIEVDGCRELFNIRSLPERPAKDIYIGNATVRCEKLGHIDDVEGMNVRDLTAITTDSVLFLDGCSQISLFEFYRQADPSAERVQIEPTCKDSKMVIVHHPMRDTNGKPIHAHAFQICKIDSLYYWYGENKELTVPGSNISVYGVRCYTSPDFKHWTDRGLIMEPDTIDPLNPIHYTQKNERPHILHNARTGKYCMWLKSQDTDGHFVIMEADDILGPYRYVRCLRPAGFSVGDFDMWADPETGKAYVWFERPHTEVICATLTDDYLDATGEYSSHFGGTLPPFTREAPAHFVYNGVHYMFTSGTTGYMPNPSQVHRFTDPHGEYETLCDPHVDDPWEHSFGSQITCVLQMEDGTYLSMADMWLPVTNNTDIPMRTAKAKIPSYLNHKPAPRDFNPPVPKDKRWRIRTCNDAVYNADFLFIPVDMSDPDCPRLYKHNILK